MGGFPGVCTIVIALSIVQNANCRVEQEGSTLQVNDAKERDAKLFNVFTIVRFPNDACEGSSSKNGTCYTEAECDNKGGQNAGSCAQGFGVCCVFVANCGASVAENCTYFESTGSEAGQCSLEVCPCSSGICQMRLDFTSFVITGPSTSTTTVGKQTAGVLNGAGKEYTAQTQCLTDIFTVRSTSQSGQNSPPAICGTNTNEHMYADMSNDDCNSLDFALGSTGIDATIPTRSFAIKVTQIACDSNLRAPVGCTQWFYGQTTNTVRSYNYNNKKGLHLANQNQNICVRREKGVCSICWSTIDPLDWDVNGKSDTMKAFVGGLTADKCCSYGDKGTTNTKGYDCVLIPGARATALAPLDGNKAYSMFCGQSKGLGTKADQAVTKTICTKKDPFNIQFITDQIEMQNEAKDDPSKEFSGFRLAYIMSSTGC